MNASNPIGTEVADTEQEIQEVTVHLNDEALDVSIDLKNL